MKSGETLRVVAVIEAGTMSGPAKNLLRFCRRVRAGESGPRIEFTIATFHRGEPGEARTPFLTAAAKDGIPVDVIGERRRFDPAVVGGLRKVLERRRPHILQTHAVKTNFVVRAGGLGAGRRWLAFHHGYTAENWMVGLYNRLNPWALGGADGVVTVCGPFREQLVGAGVEAGKIAVLPNAIEDFVPPSADEVSALRGRLAGSGERIVLTIGRLSREKGQIHLLRAAAALAGRRPDWKFRLVLVGDGPERAALEAAAGGGVLAGRVHFAGHQQDVRPYLAAADVFALPSLTEGSPNVILEAMAAGLPIVATRVGGVPETVIDGESALLCQAGEGGEVELAAALERVLGPDEEAATLGEGLRVGARARLALFTPEAYEASLRRIYAGLR